MSAVGNVKTSRAEPEPTSHVTQQTLFNHVKFIPNYIPQHPASTAENAAQYTTPYEGLLIRPFSFHPLIDQLEAALGCSNLDLQEEVTDRAAITAQVGLNLSLPATLTALQKLGKF